MAHWNDDTTLLAAFQNGDTEAEKAVFDRYFQPLCLFAERITVDLQAAEDIVSESFIKVIDRRRNFSVLPQLRSFLYQTVRNASINQAIARQRHHAIHEKIRYQDEQAAAVDDDALETEMLRAELIREIYDEIEDLPHKCGQIFKMIFVEQLPTDEIAARLFINPQTVRTQKARAIQLIRTSLLKKNRIPALLLLYTWLQLTALS